MVKVTRGELQRATRKTSSWSAANLEILLIPKVKNVWHNIQTNKSLFLADASVYRHKGGYYFAMYNNPELDSTPQTTWGGVRRHSDYRFIELLTYWAGGAKLSDQSWQEIREAGIELDEA